MMMGREKRMHGRRQQVRGKDRRRRYQGKNDARATRWRWAGQNEGECLGKTFFLQSALQRVHTSHSGTLGHRSRVPSLDVERFATRASRHYGVVLCLDCGYCERLSPAQEAYRNLAPVASQCGPPHGSAQRPPRSPTLQVCAEAEDAYCCMHAWPKRYPEYQIEIEDKTCA